MSYDPPCGSGGQVTGATSRKNYDKNDVVHCVSEAGSL
jgi:hypothetical protein